MSTDTLTTENAVQYQQWVCNVCGWIYDEAAGAPDHGLQPGTRLQDIPDDWYCPECGVTKADFIALDF
jgi:rubredoxin-NAD+ reductase